MKKLLRKIENILWPILPIKWKYDDEGLAQRASVDSKALIYLIVFYTFILLFLVTPLFIFILWLTGYEKWPWQ